LHRVYAVHTYEVAHELSMVTLTLYP